MNLFNWLKRPITPDGSLSPSALAGMLASGQGVILEKHQTLVLAPKYPEAERIAASLRDYPEDWSWKHKGYTLAHVPTGFVLWVGNKDYGLEEDHGSHRTDFQKPEQAIIWPAVEAWLERFKVGFSGRLPKVKITGKRGTYWCVADGHPWAGAGNSPADAYRAWSRAVSIQARKDINPTEYLHVWSAAL
jgi:hypothetical protein